MNVAPQSPTLWWERDDLDYREGQLYFASQNLADLARSAGTPTYVYSAARVKANLERLKMALTNQGVNHRVFYALKANRYLPLVTYLKLSGLCGVDTCSPREILLARRVGFQEDEILFTGTSVSNEDLAVLQRHPNVWVNCDSLSSIRRLGQRCPGRTIGLRINLQLGVGYHEALTYAGDKASKFGIYQDRYQEALDIAHSYGLTVKTLHFHSGSGYLNHQLEDFDQILQRAHWFLDQCPTIDTLDIGGGLGVPLLPSDHPLELDAWAKIIATHANERGLEIHIEPGDYLVKDAGVMVTEINTVERKGDTTFLGVNAGLGIQNFYAYYDIPVIPTPVTRIDTTSTERVTIAGHINEAIDIFAEDLLLSPVAEGDFLAFLNVGGYGSANSSDHCMRGEFSEYLLLP